MDLVPAFGAGQLAQCSAARQLGDALPDEIDAEIFRVEVGSIPSPLFAVLGMPGIGHRLQKHLKSRLSADVLRRSSALSADEARIFLSGIRLRDGFDLDGASPIVAEVIGVGESRHPALHKRAEPEIPGV